MKIAFNPSTVAALTSPPNNKDITFDLKGHSIYARGVEFKGTDTNTWRDIKVNNVSIGSHTLDLRNGSNTTLTNTNGVVTINSTWRPVVDSLTSNSTTSSLSANQGRVLKALIDGKSDSGHNHDGRYVRYYVVTTLDCNNLAAGLTAARVSATNAAHINHSVYLYISDIGTPFQIQIPDSNVPYIYKRYYSSGKWNGWFKLNAGYADSAGSVAWANITGKPSSYTPSAHTHAWNSLTHSSTTENQAILTNGKANGWKLYTLNISGWNNAANNAHSHANKAVLDSITSGLVSNWNTAYNFVHTITGTDTDKVINKWDEIVNFLAGITEDNKLNTLLNSKLSVYELADKTNVGTIKNNGIYYSTTDASSGTLTNPPFNNGFALINITSYDRGDDLRRSRLAFNAYGEIKVSDDRGQANTAETWYNVLTSKNSGISGSTIKLNGTSITVYSSGTADGRYVKKSGDTMTGVLTIDTTNFGALTIKRNDDANGASIQFRGKSSVYGYIGLNNSTKDKQFLRWNSDTSKVYTILDTSSTYTSSGKGVINGTTITQVDNATNSDKVDGLHATSGNNKPWGTIPAITTSGYMDIGKHLEFHYDNSTGSDYSTALMCQGNYSNIVYLPSASGTLALTSQVLTWKSQIIDMRNYSGSYWHPVTVSLPNFGYNKIKVSVQLNSGDKPSWATHNSGFTCNMEIWATASGWGTTDSDTICLNYTYKFCSQNPCGWMQLGNPSLGVVFLRGGSRYTVYTDFDATFTPHNQKYTWSSGGSSQDTGGPHTSCPGLNFNMGAIRADLIATMVQAIRVCAGHDPGIDNSISCSNWFRSSGNTGWYNTTYQGGWYMSDTSWIRAHNNVGIYTGGQIYSSSSIRMGNILLEHTNEINNMTSGGLHLNYRNSGDVSLCAGGGNVGIGTMGPAYKLDVNGQVKASGFHHSNHSNDDAVLLAGGGYKTLNSIYGGDINHPVFLGYLNLDHGNDGTVSSSFSCLGYSVPFTYTRGGNYCRITIPDTTYQVFYIKAATASVNYSGGGMDTWVGYHRGSGAWWLHCYASGANEVKVKGFRQSNNNNDSWWGGNPLWSNNDGANKITVCIFGYVKFR